MYNTIISGYYQLFKSLITGRITMLAYHRSEVCYDCDERNGQWCKVCGCYIPAKVRGKGSACPRKYWQAARLESVKGGGVRSRGACD